MERHRPDFPSRGRAAGPLVAALVVLAAPVLMGSGVPPAEGRKLALIVAIHEYQTLPDLSSHRDVPLVVEALGLHGFAASDVRVLSEAVTAEAIVRAFREALIDRARSGDIVFFHYSGHGTQITDDNGDEVDGYDEALVPFDVPAQLPAGYAGERLLRDDVLGGLLSELRARVGPEGNVVVSIDACFSGSITRASAPSRRARPEPIGPPAPTRGSGAGADQGLVGDLFGGAAARGTAARMAPFVLLSAARHDEPAFETKNQAGEYVGSLSLALSEALARARPGDTYRSLFESIKSSMGHRVRNQPQGEGDLDTELFNGTAVEQAPYFDVEAYYPDTREARVVAGELQGMIPPSLVEFHRSGALEPSPETFVARGTVTRALATRSLVELEQDVSSQDIEGAKAFMVRQSFGEFPVRVSVAGLEAGRADAVRRRLGSEPAIVLTEADPDVRLVETGGAVEAVALATGYGVGSPVDPARRGWEARLAVALSDFGRSRYLKRMIGLETPGLEVRLHVIPVDAVVREDRLTGELRCEVARELTLSDVAGEGGEVRFEIGDHFVIELENAGARDAYVSVLDLMPDGSIGILWPQNTSAQDNHIPAGRTHSVYAASSASPMCYQVAEPIGTETLMVIATEEPIDFGRIASRARGSGPGGNELSDLFQDVLNGVRADTPGTVPRGGVSVDARTIVVVRD
ncbi:MAG: caspase family protein [Longimicrobiales bacterium]